MSDTIIRVENLGKKYQLGRNTGQAGPSYRTLRDTLSEGTRNLFRQNGSSARTEEFWALRDVNFEVKQGEVIGIIGRNGAGKSTLLKILSRITEPTRGKIHIKGRIASLLEVGTGFHPELTGRENIFLNGAILGMTRVEIKAKFDEIVAFAEVESFLDTPVKRYSSGMYVRLAFAVAAHLEPEILLVDEVLAVGDSEFQQKCLGKMRDVSRTGRTVLFVSHTMQAIAFLCTKAILLERGNVACSGAPTDVIANYLGTGSRSVYTAAASGSPQKKNRILSAWLELPGAKFPRKPASRLPDSATVELVVRVAVDSVTPPYIIASFWDELRRPLWEISGGDYQLPVGTESELRLQFELPPLATSTLSIDLAIGATHVFDDHVPEAITCTVESQAQHRGGGQRFPLYVEPVCTVGQRH